MNCKMRGRVGVGWRAGVFGAVVLVSGSVRASPTFPDRIKSDLKLRNAPDCAALCHTNETGGTNTVNKPFGRSLQRLGLMAANLGSLDAALKSSEAQGIDSDGDGVPDITELKEGRDPNIADPVVPPPGSSEDGGPPPDIGDGVATPTEQSTLPPPLQTGCAVATRAPGSTGSGDAFSFVAFGAFLLLARRARNSHCTTQETQ